MINAESAWAPLPALKWNRQAARHLAARIGFSIHPRLVDLIEAQGPTATLQAVLNQVKPFPVPDRITQIQREIDRLQGQFDEADGR